MPRYVWTTKYHWRDGPDAGEDLGIFTSKRKAMNEARENARLPKGSRKLKWQPLRTDHTLFRADLLVETGTNIYDKPITDDTYYYVARRVVR